MNAFLFVVVLGQANSGKPVHPGRKPAPSMSADTKPVTAREVRESFVRTSELLKKSHGYALGTPGIPAADRPATRSEIVAEMARIYRTVEPSFRFTPVPLAFDATKFRIDAAQKASLSKLVTRGCVGPVGPLAVGPTPGLSPKQFGDALGMFVARVAQMSHLPSAKWTPMLQRP